MQITKIQQSNIVQFGGNPKNVLPGLSNVSKSSLDSANVFCSKYQKCFDEFEKNYEIMGKSLKSSPFNVVENIKLIGKTLKSGFKVYMNF